MKINILSNHIDLNTPLREFIEKKIGALGKLLPKGPVSINIEVGKPSMHHKKGMVFYAEANMKIGSSVLRAEAQDYNLHTAIDRVRDKLKIEIVKFKEKGKGHPKHLKNNSKFRDD